MPRLNSCMLNSKNLFAFNSKQILQNIMSEKKILSKKMLDDLVCKSFMQTSAATPEGITNPCPAQSDVKSPADVKKIVYVGGYRGACKDSKGKGGKGNFGIKGKNVAYVGGINGIGYAACEEMVKKGIKALTIIDIKENDEKLDELQCLNDKLKLCYFKLNLVDGRKAIEKTIKSVVENMGQLDVLVNGSGIVQDRKPELTIATNLTGVILTTLAAIPHMSKAKGKKGGLIVNVASVLGLEPGPFIATYTSTKHGVIGWTRCMADEHYYKLTGIAHMAICPGLTVSNLLDGTGGFKEDSEGFVGVDTFDYSKPLSEKFMKIKTQTSEECAPPMVAAINKGENGSIVIIDLGEAIKVKPFNYWNVQF